ncbi:fatty acyl-AMP ligase [Streptomyces sp. NBC_01618]|uniref:fatty acyl-AMP ligase n=1 Tax=Streptomyces sp. NBC_01618 TaxID=2975900 RepID=UPI0038673F9C|nr:fatty acyl-AMP ligase [Streptomyces sp. NBC_01618]
MDDPRHFIELTCATVEERANHDAYLFVHESADGGLDAGRMTYRELGLAARRIASWLQERGAAGQRVLVLNSDTGLHVTSFLGCLYAGAVAVPAPSPLGARKNAERFVGMVKDAAASFVLTDAATAPAVSQLLACAGHADVVCLAADRPGLAEPDAWRMPDLAPDDTAFLQYTSGSVSEPKGVMVSHRNLLANQRAIAGALATTADSVVGGWLPSHHDMGLTGQILHPLWLGATGVLMPAVTFAKHPVRWLEMIGRYDVTVGGGPNFAYDLCLRRIDDEQIATLDLSSWRTAVNGGEPVQAQTLDAFADRFAPAGLRPEAMYPAYGMAEATLMVAGGVPGQRAARHTVDAGELLHDRLLSPRGGRKPARTLISSGRVRGADVRIVDPDSAHVLPEGCIGEIWIRGEGVSRGYWKRPHETAEVFQARTATVGEGGFFRTGDRGFLDENGELYVTGRRKDVMIVSGRNVYPQDVERCVQKVSVLFGSAAAFSVEAERDHVVIVQEVRTGRGYDAELPALAAAIQSCVAEEFEVSADTVLLVRPGTVRRTTSGKLQRSVMRNLFLTGGIQPLHGVIAPAVQGLVGAGSRQTVGSAAVPTAGSAAGLP